MNTPAESRSGNGQQAVAELGQIGYLSMAEEWLGSFLDWRANHGPEEHLAVAQQLQPRRFRLSSPNSTVENLMIRSTNDLDLEASMRISDQRGKARALLKVGESFYRKGNYASHRDEIFEAMADKGIDRSMAELYIKLAEVINIIPEPSLEQQGFSKLCRTVGGFAFLSALERDEDKDDFTDIENALRLGYDFGVTYPLVDDLLHDSDYMDRIGSDEHPTDMNAAIEHLLTNGDAKEISIPDNSITRELLRAFEDAKQIYPFESNKELYRAMLVLHKAQIADKQRANTILTSAYEGRDYLPYIVKAAMTRIIPLMVARGGPSKLTVPSLKRVIGLGLRTQLHDDLVDISSDLQTGAHTPFSPYFVDGNQLPDLNPSELFIDSLFYSLDKDYRKSLRQRAARVLLGTAAHAFRATEGETISKLGISSDYTAVIDRVIKRYPSAKVEGTVQSRLDQLALGRSRLFKKFDVYMFDVQDRVAGSLNKLCEATAPEFHEMYSYALDAHAKRLRPALAYITADTFGVERAKLDRFAVAAELLHTASLIFDDLPGQDDAAIRRGRPTLHKKFSEGEAQMAALAMIFDAQDILNEIDTEYRLGGKLVQYATRSLGQRGLSAGQLLDLRTGGESRFTPSVDTLDNMAHLKTGLAIEMGLIGSALIAQQPPEIISRLQEYARHAGIAFQVKDDLLDVMSNESTLGKDCGADAKNHKPNYVSLLGVNDANSKLAHHLQQAKETITGLPKPIITRKFIEILDYIADRKM